MNDDSVKLQRPPTKRKYGEVRSDGLIFHSYKRRTKKDGQVSLSEKWLSPDGFQKQKERMVEYRKTCRIHVNKTIAKWRHANPDKYLDRKLINTYGISLSHYETKLEFQKGRCAICRYKPGVRRLAVDHDHTTGVVRGLLCFKCNSAIGKFRDSPPLLRRAAEYLESHQQN